MVQAITMKHRKEVSENIDEYIEEMYRCELEKREITTKGLAEKLKISMPSVSEMLAKLKAKGLVEYEPRLEIRLTAKGRKGGKRVYAKHKTILSFLISLGIDEKKAEEEACRMEHAVSDEVERRIRKKTSG